jgi:CRISPR type IV-associated protein Csf3
MAHTADNQRFEPLTITASTPHGVVLSRPWGIALDGLLASVLWHRHKWAARTAGTWLTYNPDQQPQLMDLPLARCGDPDDQHDWHWMATFADLHPHHTRVDQPDVRWRTSRTDRQRLQHLTPAISSRTVSNHSGRYQHRTIPVTAHPAVALTWRAVGDADLIRDLLSDLSSIGKHRGVGEGLVTSWDVTPTPDLARWDAGHTHEPGILGRTVPARCLNDSTTITSGPLGTATVRPPYLHPATRTIAYQPAR